MMGVNVVSGSNEPGPERSILFTMIGAFVPSSNVWPSYGDRATAAAPISPAAPTRFSTRTRCRRRFDRSWARKRAIMSGAPPAANGTIRVIGYDGQACDIAGDAIPITANVHNQARMPDRAHPRINILLC